MLDFFRRKRDDAEWQLDGFLERRVNRTNDDLVDRIERDALYDGTDRPALHIDDPRIIAALRRVDRKLFIPENEKSSGGNQYYLFGADVPDDAHELPSKACAYADLPVHIGKEMTCSQPSLVAYMIQLLDVKPGMNVLEVGSGCGYAAAILAELGARVVGVERVWQLHILGQQNAQAHFGPEWMKRTLLLHTNGLHGFPAEGPYDRIMMSARPPEGFDLRPLIEQLREQTGILLFPDDWLIQRRYDKGIPVEGKCELQVHFVPLKEGKDWE